MRRVLCMVLALACTFSILCSSAAATEELPIRAEEWTVLQTSSVMRATGSYNLTVPAKSQGEGDTTLPMAAGETVRIYAVYSPADASVDFGLVDSNDIFHYNNASNGTFDKTYVISSDDNYRLGIRNNSNVAVKVSGFVRY